MNTYKAMPGSYSETPTWDWFGINRWGNVLLGTAQNMTVAQRVEYLNAVRTGKAMQHEHKADGLEGPSNKVSTSGALISSENNNTQKQDFKNNYNI
jgi:hypothetical protein